MLLLVTTCSATVTRRAAQRKSTWRIAHLQFGTIGTQHHHDEAAVKQEFVPHLADKQAVHPTQSLHLPTYGLTRPHRTTPRPRCFEKYLIDVHAFSPKETREGRIQTAASSEISCTPLLHGFLSLRSPSCVQKSSRQLNSASVKRFFPLLSLTDTASSRS